MKYAIITGASKGIGKAIAEELASRGWNLLLVARSENKLKEVADALHEKYSVEAAYLALDLSGAGAVKTLYDFCIEKNIQPDFLVNNAGYGLSGDFEKYSLQEQENMMQLNMQVPVEMINRFLPVLRKQPKAWIMNIGSSAAYQAVPALSLYAASKAFILSFSRGLRQELKGSPVSVTVVCPGSTDTDFVVRANIEGKALKTANKVNMTPEAVAKIAVRATLAGRAEVITGVINKLGAFLVWLLPKGLVEKTAHNLYKP